ncbi:undecaprenyl-diphosphate phosphatase [Leptotrichia sp. OH3620_COT-345]|uniref:undecaprenyl-diphosphate phosphatase n=1 Tax=Leptotrichia sp. OH3620_COT-345 TaxID=2491048 RepID=UPI000F64D6E8|nr:undecaprenyl-diphosphate phosphatase [Leptotrichia sp. OH3620_COT-345]RRD38268.1 undecaprenyl-diphosphate phosphatase [Leptotrichia sp. OH3620_COT-345]
MIFDILKVTILSLIEGLTEFIPVSSTGHMIIADSFLRLSDNEIFVNAFKIIIQLGAIMSVVVYFWEQLWPFSKKLEKKESGEIILKWIKIIIAVLPAVILGLLFDDIIDRYFFNSLVVAVMLVFYGIILIWIETNRKETKGISDIGSLSISKIIGIGLFQCLAMIPGTSRSAVTIIGGVFLGLSRVAATEFSFFLAIPTMTGATLLKIVKIGTKLTGYEWFLISVGFVMSFIFAYAVIKIFMNYIKKHDFKIFGYYRIVLGIIVFILYFKGVIK